MGVATNTKDPPRVPNPCCWYLYLSLYSLWPASRAIFVVAYYGKYRSNSATLTGLIRVRAFFFSAQIRQYFKDSSFYEDDVTRRGLCSDLSNANLTNSFTCEAFSPSAATVKVRPRST